MRDRRLTSPAAIVALLLLVFGAALLLFFGGPQQPARSASALSADPPPSNEEPGGAVGAPASAPSGTQSPEADGSGDTMPWEDATGAPPEGGAEMPLIPIPGCRCHSDDPAVVEEHARYRLADCAECH
jgi:hypothetical protein